MPPLFAQATSSFWSAPNNSTQLWMKIIFGLIVGIGLFLGMLRTPTQVRKYVIFTVTFVSGLFYVLFFAYPQPISRKPTDAPRNMLEGFSFWLSDSQPVVSDITNILASFLIGLGIYSLLRVHFSKIAKRGRDWGFSVVLVSSMFLVILFGYVDYIQRFNPANASMSLPGHVGWGFWQYGYDLMFNGLLQNMDAGMFSIVAFYILSAAYRAFRARSVEATILLVSALVVMLSLMGLVTFFWKQGLHSLPGSDYAHKNFEISSIASWLKANVQTPSIRGIDFGVGIGLVAMALRLWLNLEKTGGDA